MNNQPQRNVMHAMRAHVDKVDNQEDRASGGARNAGNKGKGNKAPIAQAKSSAQVANKRDYVKGPSAEDAGDVLGFEVKTEARVTKPKQWRGDDSDDEPVARGRGGRGRGGRGRGDRGGHVGRDARVQRTDEDGNTYTDNRGNRGGRGGAKTTKHEGFDKKDGTGKAHRGGRKGEDRGAADADAGGDEPVQQQEEEQKVQALPEVKYEVIGQSFDDFAKTRTVKGGKEDRKTEGVKDVKVAVNEKEKVLTKTIDKKAYATYAKTTSEENKLFGFGGANKDDEDQIPARGGTRGGRGGRGGAAAARPKKQVYAMDNDDDFPSL